MAIIDELIFWISWLVALVATPLIWYCWFMVLRIGCLHIFLKIIMRPMLFCGIFSFITTLIADSSMEGRREQNNLRDFCSFLFIFCLTSLVIGSGVFWGMAYLIDVLIWK